MKKKNIIKLISSSKTGYFFVKRKSKKNTKKIYLKKYDPILRKHVIFKEIK